MKKTNLYMVLVLVIFSLSCNSNKKAVQKNKVENTHQHNATDNHSHNNDYFKSYNLTDEVYGTETTVTVSGNMRKMISNALPNHKTGVFPNSGNPNTIKVQNISKTFPLNPVYTGKAQWVREPGVALNGVKFEPGTAEVVTCDTGENYRVEAFQDVIDLGLDFNNAHVQPTGEYHYHGAPTSIIDSFDNGEDLVHVGFAHDGFPMYFSKSEKYKPSYKLLDGNREGEDCIYENPHNKMDISVGGHHDGTYGSDFEFIEGYGDLDECNGITVNDKYIYLVTKEFPYVSRCLMGEVNQDERRSQGRAGKGQGRPSIKDLMSNMDNNNDGKLSKSEVKGPLQNDFSRIDTNKDGFLSKEEIEKGARPNRQRQGRRQ